MVPVTRFDLSKYPVRFGGECTNFDITKYGVEVKEARRLDRNFLGGASVDEAQNPNPVGGSADRIFVSRTKSSGTSGESRA